MGFLDKILGRKDLSLREPRFGGLLYPADPSELSQMLESLLEEAAKPQGQTPRALIVPCADYRFAGAVMATAWAAAEPSREAIEQVVLVGSSRLVPFRGLAVTGYDGFDTPIGPLVFDRQAIESLAALDSVRAIEPAFDPEESLEAQLPFIKRALGDVSLVPVLVGDSTGEKVEEVVARFLDDPTTLVVVSTNLSTDVDAEDADALDDQTRRAVEALDAQALGREHSPGRVALRGLLRAAKARGLRAELLDRRTSQQTARDSGVPVTGYAAFAFYTSS